MPYGRDVVISSLWFLSSYGLRLTLYALRLRVNAMLHAPCFFTIHETRITSHDSRL